MSTDDVYPYEMNEPHDLDDRAADAFLSGGGRDVDPQLADVLGDMRAAYTSTAPAIGAELSAMLAAAPPTHARSFLSRRLEQIRASMLAKIGVGAAAVIAATGSLAAAGALPAPVKDAVSHFGITTPSHHGSDSPAQHSTATPTPADPTGNHGGDTPGGAHDPNPGTDGCVSGCDTTTTISDGTAPPAPPDGGVDTGGPTPTTIEPDNSPTPTTAGVDDSGGTTPTTPTTPTTSEPDNTPTTVDNSPPDPSADTSPSGDTTPSTPAADG